MKIETKAVEALLSGNHILEGIGLAIGDRDLVGVIGPNGSGKSTLLKCIYRVLKPTKGAVYLDGNPLDSYSFCAFFVELGALMIVASTIN